jgi:hypothetical protein
MNPEHDFDALINRLPEPEQWLLLQNIIANRAELQDDTVRRLDDRMQGFLFLQDYVTNREARIEFARSKRHMPYLRAAAGGAGRLNRSWRLAGKPFTGRSGDERQGSAGAVACLS